jgi:hypothetical protein
MSRLTKVHTLLALKAAQPIHCGDKPPIQLNCTRAMRSRTLFIDNKKQNRKVASSHTPRQHILQRPILLRILKSAVHHGLAPFSCTTRCILTAPINGTKQQIPPFPHPDIQSLCTPDQTGFLKELLPKELKK